MEVTQSTMLNPMEDVEVVKYCLGLHSMWGLQMALMIQLSTQLYLRNKELRGIKIEHFEWNLSVRSPAGLINGIMLRLHGGKTDTAPQLMMIWRDAHVPMLDLTWTLFLYLERSGLRSGYLFPWASRWTDRVSGVWGPKGSDLIMPNDEKPVTYHQYNRAFAMVLRACGG